MRTRASAIAVDQSGSKNAENRKDQSSLGFPTFSGSIQDLKDGTATFLHKFAQMDTVKEVGICLIRVPGAELEILEFRKAILKDGVMAIFEIEQNALGSIKITNKIGALRSAGQKNRRLAKDFQTDNQEQHWSDSELKNLFNDFGTSTEQFYMIGPTWMLPEYEPLLDSGSLKEAMATDIPGVTSGYLYISPVPDKRTYTRLHKEDCDFASVNLVLAGAPKVWLSIEPAHNTRLKLQLRRHFPELRNKKCSNTVSHLNSVIPTGLLDKWKINYRIQVCRPGELVFTMPGTYHQIVNLGRNVAESINLMFPGMNPPSIHYLYCNEKRCNTAEAIDGSYFVREGDTEQGSLHGTKRQIVEGEDRNPKKHKR
ncbi:unnamed protein product [Periconia digitata]|uniref:JmjC domain-containing protein n=1 Tax=Periconia digitata TaxID=1303443 RepID=A0A9W4U5D5_9PLEO|nr:unnamed protein product [Periconia digitata]